MIFEQTYTFETWSVKIEVKSIDTGVLYLEFTPEIPEIPKEDVKTFINILSDIWNVMEAVP